MIQLFKEYHREITVPIFKDIKTYYIEMITTVCDAVKECFKGFIIGFK